MKKFFLTVSVIFFFLTAYSQKSTDILIEVSYSSLQKDTITMLYQNNAWAATPIRNKELADPTANNHFSIQSDSIGKFIYFSLQKKDDSYLLVNYIAEPGDSVKIFVNRDGLIFRGKGSAKYQCRYDMDKIARAFPFFNSPRSYHTENKDVVLDSLYSSFYPVSASNSIKHVEGAKNCSNFVLEAYRDQISSLSYYVLKADLYGKSEKQILSSINSSYNVFGSDVTLKEKRRIQNTLVSIYLKKDKQSFNEIPDSLLAYSAGFLDFKTYQLGRSEANFSGAISPLPNPDKIYSGVEEIYENYEGILRDRLVTHYLLKSHKRLKNGSAEMATALKFVNDLECISLLGSLNNSTKPGSQAYNFSLSDITGKIRTMDGFKGKVVLLDFWFTGCTGCKVLAQRMKPIIGSYKNNKNLVFISISVDKDTVLWKESVSKEIYTNKGSIDLFTEGLGTNNPVVKHYGVTYYPTLILFDKKGRVVTTSVPSPENQKSKEALLSLIDKQL
ncbi:hypothetical protein A0O34_21575 [Chryseobacterium glaciei]|uniref:Thioredoxin domain-containing protein n=1 Tax=Chryseobacterium glaciei TaxID=1685010 RepID=A0A172Y111_9FLAO|nr:TlpA disulfide reductase family protein [Chryseobacterium glaciei]ANF52953.1 hypothetical protein A0O34_21575 [Chryseobacterium glaciei]